ncbi:hypothetical protein [Bdellovibrio sp. NC01]|uniref:hypothetical protein n=1 Tax=Bdellovibrio sp. NC01 TaxID=2220073 RepID=UPI00115ADFB4|nr:hypothetical protein [Bdellovibrio sp. NC01]QDK38410.1 hypothetical protein DOE51_12905 [Bdellovibrio sp. NC01]
MKRNGVGIFLILVVAVAVFFYWKRQGAVEATVSQHKTSEAQKPESNEQASSKPSLSASQANTEAGGPQQGFTPRAEVPDSAFFNDNGKRKMPTEGILARNRNPNTVQVRPSAEQLTTTPLWEDGSWKVWNHMTAVPTENYNGTGKAIGQVGSFTVVEASAFKADEHNFSSSQPIVVYKDNGQRPGLISGSYLVVLRDSTDFESFVLDHGLRLLNAFPETRSYYVTAGAEPFDLSLLLQTMRNDPRVETANVQVVTERYAKK